jgi:hypothetical protein
MERTNWARAREMRSEVMVALPKAAVKSWAY